MNNEAVLTEVQSLRRDLADLTARVLLLESRASSAGSLAPFASPQSPLVVNYTGNPATAAAVPPFPDFGSTSPTPSPLLPSSSQSGPALAVEAISSTSSPLLPSSTQLGSAPVVLSEASRLAIAEEAGRFLRRCLEGVNRGTSGRERIGLQSRCYILVRDYEGQVYSPVQIHHRFATIKPLVKRGSDCGTSIFIGWPTLKEARACVLAAELVWPADERF